MTLRPLQHHPVFQSIMSSSTSTPSLETVRKELEMTHQLLSLERSAFQRERELLEQQVRLTRAVATGKGRTQGAIGVFWDYGASL